MGEALGEDVALSVRQRTALGGALVGSGDTESTERNTIPPDAQCGFNPHGVMALTRQVRTGQPHS